MDQEISSKIDSPKIWEEVSGRIFGTFEHYLPELSVDPNTVASVVSVGCGTFMESGGLQGLFPEARIVGYDQDTALPFQKRLHWVPEGVERKYGVVGEGVLGKGENDIVLVRNPDIHRPEGWKRALQEGMDSLNEKGVMVITTMTEDELRQVREILPSGHVVLEGENAALSGKQTMIYADNFILAIKQS